MNNFKMNIQLFAEEATDGIQEQSVDYQALYTQAMGENEKLKNQMSKVNSENAEYKRKAKAQMSDEEKKVQEHNDLLAQLDQVQKQLDAYKLKDTLAKQGYTSKEIDLLIDGGCSAEVYAKIMNDRLTAQAESIKAQNIVNSTTTPPVGTVDGGAEPMTRAQRILSTSIDNAQEIKNKFNK